MHHWWLLRLLCPIGEQWWILLGSIRKITWLWQGLGNKLIGCQVFPRLFEIKLEGDTYLHCLGSKLPCGSGSLLGWKLNKEQPLTIVFRLTWIECSTLFNRWFVLSFCKFWELLGNSKVVILILSIQQPTNLFPLLDNKWLVQLMNDKHRSEMVELLNIMGTLTSFDSLF